MEDTSESHLQTKIEELIDLDESIRTTLTPEECVRLAGGFGATDESIAKLLKDARKLDEEGQGHRLQDIVNEGLASAVRAGDYHTSRQLLILYSLVASEGIDRRDAAATERATQKTDDILNSKPGQKLVRRKTSDAMLLHRQSTSTLSADLPPPPPPPPLDTDRLRSATNSDGLLAVLGAAQVLRAMQDGGAKKRTMEAISAVEEWVEHGEQSMAFRLASWRDQRAAQGDLKIAMQKNSEFLAFVSNKAISNRKTFAKQMKDAVSITDFTDVRFLHAVHEILDRMHSPCLRLELLQYILGLDNRYSVAHVKRSVELATTCLSIAATSVDMEE